MIMRVFQRVHRLRARRFTFVVPRGQQWHPCDNNAFATKNAQIRSTPELAKRAEDGRHEASWEPLATCAEAGIQLGCIIEMLVCI